MPFVSSMRSATHIRRAMESAREPRSQLLLRRAQIRFMVQPMNFFEIRSLMHVSILTKLAFPSFNETIMGVRAADRFVTIVFSFLEITRVTVRIWVLLM